MTVRIASDRAGGLRPEPAAQSQPVGAHPLRKKGFLAVVERTLSSSFGEILAFVVLLSTLHLTAVQNVLAIFVYVQLKTEAPDWLKAERAARRDSDASLAEDPKGLSGEAVAARAEGIAQ